MRKTLGLILSIAILPALALADVRALSEISNAFQSSGDLPFANQQTKPARLPIGSTGQVLVVGSNGFPTWASTGGALGGATFTSLTSLGSGTITTNTVDTTDNAAICIAGAGACVTSGIRGGYATFAGNEASDTGSVRIQSGNTATGLLTIYAPNASAYIGFGTNNNNDWQFIRSGSVTAFRNNASAAAGDIELSTTKTTLALQEGTAASRCMGPGTFNGTTAVTITTTCATTGSRIILTPTSDPTGATAAYCWYTNIVNNTSFDVDCDQANDGTFSWQIIHEAP